MLPAIIKQTLALNAVPVYWFAPGFSTIAQVAAGPPTMAGEWFISLRCLCCLTIWSVFALLLVQCYQIWRNFATLPQHENTLAILKGSISIRQSFELTLANFIYYWANSHCLKWQNIKNNQNGHKVTLFLVPQKFVTFLSFQCFIISFRFSK